jgi:hypothetical protein
MPDFRPIPENAWPAIFAEIGLAEQQREAAVLRLVMEFKTVRLAGV